MNTDVDVAKNLAGYMLDVGQKAREASLVLARADSDAKACALTSIAAEIRAGASDLQQQNALDMEAGRQSQLTEALIDRLELTPARIESMAAGLDQIARLTDPVGTITDMQHRPSGLQIGKMRVPLGVIGIIYESRPNVCLLYTSDAADE